MASIDINEVSKIYDKGGAKAVDSVDIQIEDGEFIVLVGPSGCGKSTLLRMVAGLEDISQGTISIGDRVVNQIEPADRDIAMVFQNYALYPHMTVYDNLAYGLKNRGTPKAEIAARVAEAAKMLEIEKYLDRKPRQLSGGQRQRVAMGRSIVRDPKCFLFDEPLSNLDAQLRNEMRTEIKKLHARLGKTIIYVTHDQVEAMTLADRIAVLSGGRVMQYATPDEIYHRPAARFVAGFTGSPAMNFLRGRLSPDAATFEAGAVRIALPPALAKAAGSHAGQSVDLGIRPEDLAIASERDDYPVASVPATVVVLEPLGAETLVTLRIGEHELVCRARPDVGVQPGQTVDARMRLDKMHLFDAESGIALR